MSSVKSDLILLHDRDNILVASRHLSAGESIEFDGQQTTIVANISVGHKIARISLSAGDQVVRFGAPIGSMTAAASIGEHVHLHNMKSDYIASHHRNAVELDGDAK